MRSFGAKKVCSVHSTEALSLLSSMWRISSAKKKLLNLVFIPVYVKLNRLKFRANVKEFWIIFVMCKKPKYFGVTEFNDWIKEILVSRDIADLRRLEHKPSTSHVVMFKLLWGFHFLWRAKK